MLRALNFSLLSLTFSLALGSMSSKYAFAINSDLQYEKAFFQQQTCLERSYKISPVHVKDLQALQEESFKKVDELQQNKEFQELVSKLYEKLPNPLSACQTAAKESFAEAHDYNTEGRLYIFVSFSLGEKALINLAYEAKRFGATLVLRGFKEESYKKTVYALQKIILKTGQGVSIDPEFFTLFSVTSVPTYILAKPIQFDPSARTQIPLCDRMQGHVSAHYALETFAKEGDLQSEAKALLPGIARSYSLQKKGRAK